MARMFALTYLRRELRRRLGRTVLTVLGLAVGVGLVAAITAISHGLDEAQGGVLDPLNSVGTDLMVTQPVAAPGEGGGPGQALGALARENATLITDLSQLGDPGEQFEHTFFAAATNLTFDQDTLDDVASLDGLKAVSVGLTLTAIHQQGTVPEIVAEFETGGETFTIEQDIEPLTPQEQREVQECMQANQGPQGRRACLPERFQRFRGEFTTPRQTLRQLIDPPETDIESTTYTIAGVDLGIPGMGLLTEAQITDGSFLAADDEAVVAEAHAERNDLGLGDTLTLNDATFTIVGLAKPPLGGQTADVYLPLERLQTLSGREGRVNVLLVRADEASAVGSLGEAIEQRLEGSTVTSAEEVASQVSGSLVDAASLADRLGTVLSVALLAGAFLIAILLTLASVSKRARELGTLKAIGWRTRRVVRQVVGESLAQGALGGLVGIGLGIAAAVAFTAFAPELQASAAGASGGGPGLFGLGAIASQQEPNETIALGAPISVTTVGLAFGLALLGGLIAGAAGAWRVARLRPADAMREVG